MQVLLEAGQQPIVLEQSIVTAQVGIKLVVGLLEDLARPGAAILQLLQNGRGEEEEMNLGQLSHLCISFALPSKLGSPGPGR